MERRSLSECPEYVRLVAGKLHMEEAYLEVTISTAPRGQGAMELLHLQPEKSVDRRGRVKLLANGLRITLRVDEPDESAPPAS